MNHQICLAHVKKNVWNRLKRIEGWDWIKTRIWQLLSDLPDWGGHELLKLHLRALDHPELRRLTLELSEKWRSLTCFRRDWRTPRTNNSSERAIGRSKIRYRTTRGYQSEDGMMNGMWLTQWAWSGRDGMELIALTAA